MLVLGGSESEGLGIGVELEDQVLRIRSIEEGLVRKWNERNPTSCLSIGDKIIKINNAVAPSELLDNFTNSFSWVMQVRREPLGVHQGTMRLVRVFYWDETCKYRLLADFKVETPWNGKCTNVTSIVQITAHSIGECALIVASVPECPMRVFVLQRYGLSYMCGC